MALVGSCATPDATMVRHQLLTLTSPGAIPFAIPKGLDHMLYGYASHAWAVDLLRWANDAPMIQRDRIIGLLLGYSADAIRDFEELGSNVA